MKVLVLNFLIPAGLGFRSRSPSTGLSTARSRSQERQSFRIARSQESPGNDVLLRWAQPFSWSSEQGTLNVDGNPFDLKGVNWFGFEDPGRYPHGIDQRSLDNILGFLKDNDFNAVRLPISLSMALDLHARPSSYNNIVDPELKGLQQLDCGGLLTRIVEKCANYGLLVMPDIHRCDENKWPIEPDVFWYEGRFSADDLEKGWVNILNLVGAKWNVFAIDLKNEPHSDKSNPRIACTWGSGDPSTDWRLEAQYLANNLIQKVPDFKGLIFVEGVQHYQNTYANWGGNLQGVRNAPLELGDQVRNKRLVYSPHVYGPAVDDQNPAHYDPKYPANLPQIWDKDWGFVKGTTGHAVVLGEWGGWCNNPPPSQGNFKNPGLVLVQRDETWHKALASYLKEKGMVSNFYWSLNPDSTDTGGLLEKDWKTPIQNKLNILKDLVPNPTKFTAPM